MNTYLNYAIPIKNPLIRIFGIELYQFMYNNKLFSKFETTSTVFPKIYTLFEQYEASPDGHFELLLPIDLFDVSTIQEYNLITI